MLFHNSTLYFALKKKCLKCLLVKYDKKIAKDNLFFVHTFILTISTVKGQPHNHGQVQAERSAAAFKKAGYMVYIQTPQGKDFNEDLMVFRGKMEQEEKNSKESCRNLLSFPGARSAQ